MGVVSLSPKDVEDLKKIGYSENEIWIAMKEIENEEMQKSFGQVKTQQGFDPRQNSQISSFSSRQEDNLAKWQLELNDILERAEHILRGDIPQFQDGHIIWTLNPHPEKNALNDVGIQEIMKRLAMYVNRNTILSDYTNQEINAKVYDFGRALNNLIFMRDSEFGMDTFEKRKNYEMIVTELKDTVHSAYKRALDGAEKRSLREMIQVSQSNNTTSNVGGGGYGFNNPQLVGKERGLLNPMRYVKGKYV